METARIVQNAETIETMATTATKVQASKLQECMVVMDPELGTPALWLDHKLRTTRNSGEVTWMAHNLETGRLETLRVRSTLALAVLA